MKKKLILGGVVLSLLMFAMWASRQSYLEINASGTGQFTYNLTSQPDSKIVINKDQSGVFKKRLPKGSYEVLVSQNNTSYFTVTKTRGFFRKTTVVAKPSAERARMFIGNNPGSCINYYGGVLISYNCGDTIGSLVVHEPATNQQPTFTRKKVLGYESITDSVQGYVEGIVRTAKQPSNQALALIRSDEPEDTEAGIVHSIVSLSNNLDTGERVKLPDLDSSTTYSIAPSGTGFIVYDKLFTQVFYYADIKSKPTNKTLESPKNNKLLPAAFDNQNDTYLSLYSMASVPTDKTTSSEFIVTSAAGSKHYTFKNNYLDAKLCGKSKICALGEKSLDVYEINNKKLKFLYSMFDVLGMQTLNDRLLVVKNKNILSYDVDSNSGYSSYSFGDFRYVGIQVEDGGYIVNLIDPRESKVALWLDDKLADTSAVDRKVAEIETWTEASSVSAYGKFIFVTPDLGEVKYIDSSIGFGYDPEVIRVANSKLQARISTLQIDPSAYSIINLIK